MRCSLRGPGSPPLVEQMHHQPEHQLPGSLCALGIAVAMRGVSGARGQQAEIIPYGSQALAVR